MTVFISAINIFLLTQGSYAKTVCDRFYKGIFITCNPSTWKEKKREYNWSPEQIGKKCKRYIDKAKIDTRFKLYCHPVKTDVCKPIGCTLKCGQMHGGPLSIDGQCDPYPSNFILKKSAK